jgi:hypothetical protein
MDIKNSNYTQAVKKLEAKRAKLLARRLPSATKPKKNDSKK